MYVYIKTCLISSYMLSTMNAQVMVLYIISIIISMGISNVDLNQ